MQLENKVAVITGAANGIGRESALLFAREGAKIIVADLNQEQGEQTVRDIIELGGQAQFVRVDVSKAVDCKKMINAALDHYSALHILFNNAGIMHANDGNTESTSEEIWDLTMNINLKGVFLGCKFGIPAIKQSGGGSIINTASFVALMGAATPQIAYTASKGGVLAMSRELAVLHAKESIRINALCPGPLHTELLMNFLDTNEKKQRRLIHIPMGRFGYAEEIAKAALYLASDASSYMTGATFSVDGGITSAYVTPE